jgi:hypothetical protein
MPVVAKIVVVHKLSARCCHNLAQLTFPFVFCLARIEVIFVGYAVSLALDDELVEVRIFPAHDALQDSVELGERSVTLHLHTPPDGGLRAAEFYLDLEDFDLLWHFRRFEGGPTGGRAFRLVGEREDGYLTAAALALASSGTTPSCCMRPKASQLT